MRDYLSTIVAELGISLWLFVVIAVWSAVWKLLAFWKSARKGSVIWFIVLAICNTMGLLEILYIFVFSEMKISKVSKKRGKKKKSKKR